MTAPDLFGVVGQPISHSMSPQLFQLIFKTLKMEGNYLRITGPSLIDILNMTDHLGIDCLNITHPYKQEVIKYLAHLTMESEAIGAVNTVIRVNGHLWGANTDVAGVLGPLLSRKPVLKGLSTIVVGAGGAARAAVHALHSYGADVVIVNRSQKRRIALAESNGLESYPLTHLSRLAADADLLVWTIPGYPDSIAPLILQNHQLVLDVNYAATDSSQRYFGSAHVINGLEWLVHQGIASYQIFKGSPSVMISAESIVQNLLQISRINIPDKIALVGYMGVGKTTIGQSLASRIGYHFVDTDKQIEEISGKSIRQIFEDDGESRFRELERIQTLQALRTNRLVLATGGGGPSTPEIRTALAAQTFTLWLYASPDIAKERCLEKLNRPLFSNAAFETLHDARTPSYAAVSDCLLACGQTHPEALVDLILREITH